MTLTITVIGGGWSAGSLDNPPVGIGHVIGVNDAGLYGRSARGSVDELVSMDRLWTEHRWPQIVERAGVTLLRRSALKNITDRPSWLTPFENDHTTAKPSDDVEALNGTSSGMCAINRAMHWRPKRIVLIGFDMNRSPDGRAYWHAPYPWAKPGGATSGGKYKAWAAQFGAIARSCQGLGIEVLNTAMTSAITVFPKAPLEMLR